MKDDNSSQWTQKQSDSTQDYEKLQRENNEGLDSDSYVNASENTESSMGTPIVDDDDSDSEEKGIRNGG